MRAINITTFRNDIYNTCKEVNESHVPIRIVNSRNEKESAVIIGIDDWESIQETLYLYQQGVINEIEDYKDEETVSWEGVDWDEI